MANVLLGGLHCASEGVSSRRGRWYEVANNYGTALFIGDPVTLLTDGTVARDSIDATTLCFGIVRGVSYVRNGARDELRYLPANTTFTPTTVGSINASQVYVEQDPTGEYFISSAAALTEANARAAVGAGCDLTFATAGSTVYGWSGCRLDESTAGTSGKVQILELVRRGGRPDATGPNELDAAGVLFRVRIAEHQLINTTAAI